MRTFKRVALVLRNFVMQIESRMVRNMIGKEIIEADQRLKHYMADTAEKCRVEYITACECYDAVMRESMDFDLMLIAYNNMKVAEANYNYILKQVRKSREEEVKKNESYCSA